MAALRVLFERSVSYSDVLRLALVKQIAMRRNISSRSIEYKERRVQLEFHLLYALDHAWARTMRTFIIQEHKRLNLRKIV